jgi:O-acetylserine/cysteine efflux transporter
LEAFSAAELTALRFLITRPPAFLPPRPRIAWPRLMATGLTLFTRQSLLLFRAFEAGMPTGLASATQLSPVFFTVLLATVFLREVPSPRRCNASHLPMIEPLAGASWVNLGAAVYLGTPNR